jgi:hypothetical protein
MTHDEASAEAAKLNAEHPERDQYRWGAHDDGGGDWSVARIKLPRPASKPRLTPGSEGKPERPPDGHPLELPGGLPPYAAGG